MKKKLMKLLIQLCFIGIILSIPVLQWVKEDGSTIFLSIWNVSTTKTIVLVVALFIVFCLDKRKHYKSACVANALIIAYVGWLMFVAHTYENSYTNIKNTMICNYTVYIMLVAYLGINTLLCIKKKIAEDGEKKTCVFNKQFVRTYAIAVSCIVFLCSMASYRKVIEAKDINTKKDTVADCSMGTIQIDIENLDNLKTVYKDNEKIKITFKILCEETQEYCLQLPENDNVEFYMKDKQNIASNELIDIEFKIKNDGANEIEFTLMTNIDMSEIKKKIYLYTYTADGMTFFSFNGNMDAENMYHEWLLASGRVDLEEYEKLNIAKYNLSEEEGELEKEIIKSYARSSSSTITVKGKVWWKDVNNLQHGANEIRVEIWDEDVSSDDYITAVYTDSNGNFSVTIENDDSILEGGYDIYVKVYSRGRYVNVVSPGGNTYYGYGDFCEDADNGDTISGSIWFSNTTEVDRAFQVQQAASMASYYIYKLRGAYLDNVHVIYPNSHLTEGTRYDKDSKYIYVNATDYCDWDIIQHEYGHHVSRQLGFNDSPGGNHTFYENLCDKLGNKSQGLRLAWSEGWSHYFAIAVQENLIASSLRIPNVGDKIISNTIDETTHISVESPTAPKGEGNEMSVAAVLLDIADSTNSTESHDNIALGHQSVLNYAVNSKSTTLSSFISKVQGINNKRDLYIGQILSAVNVSCALGIPGYDVQTTSTPPTFSWTVQAASTTYNNNSFTLVFYDSKYVKIKEIAVASSSTMCRYTLSTAEWNQICNATSSGEKVYWTVKAKQTATPTTGPYFSGYKYFKAP